MLQNHTRAVPREWKSNPEAKMRNKKLYIASIHGPQVVRNKDISDADVEEYFSSYGEVVGVSQERERDGGKKKGSQYVKFSDEDPVDQAVLVGVHNVQTAVLKVERSLSWWQQEEVRIK